MAVIVSHDRGHHRTAQGRAGGRLHEARRRCRFRLPPNDYLVSTAIHPLFGGSHAVPVPDLRRRDPVAEDAEGRDGQDLRRVRRVRRRHQEERPLRRWQRAAAHPDRDYGPGAQREGLEHGRTFRGDEGAARWLLSGRGQGPERRHPGGFEDPVGAPGEHRGAADHGVQPTVAVSEDATDGAAVRDMVDAVYRSDSRRVLATLIRLLGDFDLAEEALHDAFTAAVERWPLDGVPANPRAWLVSAGRFKAIDSMRRRARFDDSLHQIANELDR